MSNFEFLLDVFARLLCLFQTVKHNHPNFGMEFRSQVDQKTERRTKLVLKQKYEQRAFSLFTSHLSKWPSDLKINGTQEM